MMRWLPWATLAAAVVAIGAGIGLLPAAVVFVAKPLATVGIIAWAWPRGADMPVPRRWVRIGLLLSLAGDVFLLWPQQGFLPGLVSFLLAHLAYLWAFTRVQRLAAWPLAFVAYALVAGGVLWLLWPGVPAALRPPVAAYVLCLASMAAQALVLWHAARGSPGAARARTLALGGALFVCSDALLATNKFAMPLPLASLWILATYWAAQACIARWLAPGATSAPELRAWPDAKRR
jgi:uncharacterized membrane protein YhhN